MIQSDHQATPNLKYIIVNSSTVNLNVDGSWTYPQNYKILVSSAAINNYRSKGWPQNKLEAIENYTITKTNGRIYVT